MSPVLGAFWRVGRAHPARFGWATAEGIIGHYAIELYSSEYGRWVYYDMNLNGYSADDDGTPLSIASLRSNLLTNEDVHPIASSRIAIGTWVSSVTHCGRSQVEWYALNNRPLYFEADRRFGPAETLRVAPEPDADSVRSHYRQPDRRARSPHRGRGQNPDRRSVHVRGARWFLAYLIAMTLLGGVTLAGPPLTRAVRGDWRRLFSDRARSHRRSIPGRSRSRAGHARNAHEQV